MILNSRNGVKVELLRVALIGNLKKLDVYCKIGISESLNIIYISIHITKSLSLDVIVASG